MIVTKQKTYLIASGAILTLAGSYISLSPAEYLNQFGITSGMNVNFYSDFRSMGGSLLVFGLLAIAGGFKKHLQAAATT